MWRLGLLLRRVRLRLRGPRRGLRRRRVLLSLDGRVLCSSLACVGPHDLSGVLRLRLL